LVVGEGKHTMVSNNEVISADGYQKLG